MSGPLQLFRNGQRLLEKQRFQFPSSWLYIDNIEGEWGAFSDIMKRKDTAIQQQVANLQMKIVQEDRAVENRTTDLLSDWEKTKPVAVRVRERDLGEVWCWQLSFSVCLLVIAAGQSASRGGAAVAHHLRGQVRPAEGRQREVCEGQRGAGADGHRSAEQQRGESPGEALYKPLS